MKCQSLFFIAVLVVSLTVQLSTQKLHRPTPSSVQQTYSFCEECSAAVLLQSHAEHVYLVCGKNSKNCPTNMVSRIPGMSWMFMKSDVAEVVNADRRHFCLVAFDPEDPDDVDSYLEVLGNGILLCSRTNVILTFPSGVSPTFKTLKTLLYVAWLFGILDVVIILQDSRCRVYTYVPFKEKGLCYDTSPILVDTWPRDMTFTWNYSGAYFPEKKISRLYMCGLNFNYPPATIRNFRFWSHFVDFLADAMDCNASTVSIPLESSVSSSIQERSGESSMVVIATLLANADHMEKFVFPSFLFNVEQVFAVPRLPISSLTWFGLLNELSGYVWYSLIVSVLVSVALLYALTRGYKDFGYVVLFALQPLFGGCWCSNFLPLHARLYFGSWLLFCVVLDSTYLCTLLSKLTAPFDKNAIGTLNDLIESRFPIAAFSIDETILHDAFSTKPYYKDLKNKTSFVNAFDFYEMIRAKHHDRAYIVGKIDFDFMFTNMSYEMLPTSFDLSEFPVLMVKPTPYERLFETSFLRALSAGALDCVLRKSRHHQLLRIRSQIGVAEGPKALSFSSFRTLFLLWSVGCFVSLFTFSLELLCHYAN